MSNKNAIDSNINMLKKAEIMYKSDLKNLALNRGKNVDQYENEQVMKSIQEKLNMLRHQKKKAMHEKVSGVYTDEVRSILSDRASLKLYN